MQKELTAVFLGGDQLFRQCLSTLFRCQFETIADQDQLDPSLISHSREMPHIVLWIHDAPRANEIATETHIVRSRWPPTRTIVLSSRSVGEDDLSLLLNGPIDALLSLEMNLPALQHAVSAVLCGERLLSKDLFAGRAWRPMPTGKQGGKPFSSDMPDLTPREFDILQALGGGLPNKVIARNLGVAEATVKVQIRGILRKIGKNNRTQAALWAKDNGLIEPDNLGEPSSPEALPSLGYQKRPTVVQAVGLKADIEEVS